MYYAVIELSDGRDLKVELFEDIGDAETHQRSLEDAYIQRMFELYNEDTVAQLEQQHQDDHEALLAEVCEMQNHAYTVELHTVALTAAVHKRAKLQPKEEDDVYEEEEEDEDEEDEDSSSEISSSSSE